ncbi:hypothetical protein D3C72_2255760 [compost metagenome]
MGTTIRPTSASDPKISANMARMATGRFHFSLCWKWLMPGSMAEATIKATTRVKRMSGILLANNSASRMAIVTTTDRAVMLTLMVWFKAPSRL